MRILYILPGLVPPNSDPVFDKFTYLSEIAEGEVLLPVWWDSLDAVSPFLKESFPIHRVGQFRYHLFLIYRFPKFLQRIASLFFYIRGGLALHGEKKFDVIITYGTNRPAVAGVILKLLTGAKLIVEIPGVPENAFRYDVPDPDFRAAIKRLFADQLLLFSGKIADCIKLLYPWQLRKYPQLQNKKVAVFHDFVPVHVVGAEQSTTPFILSVGYPWYTKGIDILIRSFKLIVAKFPEYRLKLLGFFPDRRYLDKLIGNCPQIEFVPASPHEVTLKVISCCSLYVSASRTEGMPRVLLEAMAARKPIIAAAVGGIPHYMVDDDNALLFEAENVEQLAAKLSILMGDPELQARLGARGYQKVFSEYDEQAYVCEFQKMLQSLELNETHL
jgi:glycosyltransferase involved in cell wall biosynthesis